MVEQVKIVLQDDSNSEVFIKIWATLVAHGKESACDAGNLGSVPELGRSPGEGNGNLEVAWWVAVCSVANSRTQLKQLSRLAHQLAY